MRWRYYLTVLAALTLLVWGALRFVAYVSGASVIVREVPVVLAFVVVWQLAFALWTRAWARLGQRCLYASVLCLFAPAFVAMVLTYKCKWGDGRDPLTALHLPFEAARTTTRDGLSLDGWFIPEKGASSTLLILHGAGANKGNFVWFLGPLAHHGYNLAIFDFRAHGASDGHVTSWGVRESEDVHAALDWLVAKHPDQTRKVVGLGSSQGALALTRAGATDPRIAAFVLDSPFLSARRLAQDYARKLPIAGPLFADYMLLLMSAWSSVDLFAPSAALDVALLGDRPVMLIHGQDDELVPEAHAREIFGAVRGPRALWIGTGGHSNIISSDPAGYAERVFRFLAQTLGPPAR